jgi:hypothetical protein
MRIGNRFAADSSVAGGTFPFFQMPAPSLNAEIPVAAHQTKP